METGDCAWVSPVGVGSGVGVRVGLGDGARVGSGSLGLGDGLSDRSTERVGVGTVAVTLRVTVGDREGSDTGRSAEPPPQATDVHASSSATPPSPHRAGLAMVTGRLLSTEVRGTKG